MAKVARLTDGKNNWVFFAEGGSVKMITTTLSGIYSTEEYNLEKGREAYKLVRKFNPLAQVGFTPLNRAMKSFKFTDEEHVRACDDYTRKTLGEELWAEEPSLAWEEFHYNGYHEFFYTAGNLNKELAKRGITVQ